MTETQLDLYSKSITGENYPGNPPVHTYHTLDGTYKSLSSDFAYSLIFPDYLKFIPAREPELFKSLQEMVNGQRLIEFGSYKRPLECLWRLGPREVYLVDPNSSFSGNNGSIHIIKADAVSFLRQGFLGNTLSIGMMGDDILSHEYSKVMARLIYQNTPPNGYAFHLINDFFIVNDFMEAGFKISGTYNSSLTSVEATEIDHWIYYLFKK